jgi:hypothetical protein
MRPEHLKLLSDIRVQLMPGKDADELVRVYRSVLAFSPEESRCLGNVGERDIQLAQLHLQLCGGHLPEFGTLSHDTAGHAYRLLLDRAAANLQHGHAHCFFFFLRTQRRKGKVE